MAGALVLTATGCMDRGRPPSSATGVVISVDGPSAAEVTRFTLRTDAGEVLAFQVGTLDVANGGLPAPHLREHLVSGEPIMVFYYGDRDGLYLTRYMDAPRSTAS